MPVIFIKRNNAWQKILKVYMKRSDAWVQMKTVWIKRSGTWSKVFGSGPALNSAPVLTANNGGYLYDTFTTSNGSWDNAISYTRIWLRGDTENGIYSAISGATSTTYTTTASDDGKWIKSEVTASDGTNTNQATSAGKFISKVKPVSLTAPTLSGSTRVGSSLFVTGTGTTYWKNTTNYSSDTSPSSYSYAWYKTNGSLAANSTNSDTYTPTATDVGQTIKAVVTATNTGGSTDATSAYSAAIEAKLFPNKMATPTVSNITTTNIRWNFTAPTVDATHDAAVAWQYYTNTTGVAPSASTTASGAGFFFISSYVDISYTSSTSPSTYYLWVRGENNYGDVGEWSDVKSATPETEVTRIAAPTNPAVAGGTYSIAASTSLVRINNTTKDQYWSIVRRRPLNLSWDAVSGATGYEYYFSDTNTAPAETIDTNLVTATTSTSPTYTADSGTSAATLYFWVRSVASASNKSVWVSCGSVSVAAISVTAWEIRIYRGDGTSYSNNSTQLSFWDDFSYPWTDLIPRGNPATGGEGHYAQIRFTANGTAYIRTSNTV